MREQGSERESGTASSVNGRLLNQRQAADYLGLTIPILQRQRTDGTGPHFLKLGRRKIAYRLSDIHAWIDGRVVASTSEGERGRIPACATCPDAQP